jgi:anti-sigma factor (TIGR02949 family)
MNCAEVDKFIHAYIDGEFADEDRVEFERHLAECQRCREAARFEVEFKRALRHALPRPPLPPGFRARIVDEIARAPAPGRRWFRVVYPSAAFAAAAAVTMVFVWRGPPPAPAEAPPVVEESIHRHAGNLPVEVVGPDGQRVASWFRGKVDVPVQAPQLMPVGADLLGGRVSHLRDRQAAHLIYTLRGKKVSVLVFDPRNMPLHLRRVQRIHNRDVYFDHQQGYNVAVYQQGNVGYAITSKLPESQMVQLVSAAVK